MSRGAFWARGKGRGACLSPQNLSSLASTLLGSGDRGARTPSCMRLKKPPAPGAAPLSNRAHGLLRWLHRQNTSGHRISRKGSERCGHAQPCHITFLAEKQADLLARRILSLRDSGEALCWFSVAHPFEHSLICTSATKILRANATLKPKT